MRAILLPLILAFVGLAGGAGAGWFLKPKVEVEDAKVEMPSQDQDDEGQADAASRAAPAEKIDEMDAEGTSASEFVKLNNQFVVPVVSDGSVSSLVVMSLSLEVETGMREIVFQREPKLRDALLQVMFDHANVGGFDGAFTNAANLEVLRTGLTDTARKVVPGTVFGVLIVDLARQDL
ncbi:MAG: flagellar basal body-associated protein FliL [Pseudomonadota bacterium]